MASNQEKIIITNRHDLDDKIMKYLQGTFNVSIDKWDISTVSDLSDLFNEKIKTPEQNVKLNGIEEWDVSNVINMSGMFSECNEFNQPLTKWNVQKVENMSRMFYGCRKFNQPLFSLYRDNALWNIDLMFYDCHLFNQNINDWWVNNVTGMPRTFGQCSVFNQDLNKWNVQKVHSFYGTFFGCTDFNGKIFKIGANNRVMYTAFMFEGCRNFNQNLSEWNLDKVTSMDSMFRNCAKFNNGIFHLSKHAIVNSMEEMFNGCFQFNQQTIKLWNVSNVTNMRRMFKDCRNFRVDISFWNVRKVSEYMDMFVNCPLDNFKLYQPQFNKSQTRSSTEDFFSSVQNIPQRTNRNSGTYRFMKNQPAVTDNKTEIIPSFNFTVDPPPKKRERNLHAPTPTTSPLIESGNFKVITHPAKKRERNLHPPTPTPSPLLESGNFKVIAHPSNKRERNLPPTIPENEVTNNEVHHSYGEIEGKIPTPPSTHTVDTFKLTPNPLPKKRERNLPPPTIPENEVTYNDVEHSYGEIQGQPPPPQITPENEEEEEKEGDFLRAVLATSPRLNAQSSAVPIVLPENYRVLLTHQLKEIKNQINKKFKSTDIIYTFFQECIVQIHRLINSFETPNIKIGGGKNLRAWAKWFEDLRKELQEGQRKREEEARQRLEASRQRRKERREKLKRKYEQEIEEMKHEIIKFDKCVDSNLLKNCNWPIYYLRNKRKCKMYQEVVESLPFDYCNNNFISIRNQLLEFLLKIQELIINENQPGNGSHNLIQWKELQRLIQILGTLNQTNVEEKLGELKMDIIPLPSIPLVAHGKRRLFRTKRVTRRKRNTRRKLTTTTRRRKKSRRVNTHKKSHKHNKRT